MDGVFVSVVPANNKSRVGLAALVLIIAGALLIGTWAAVRQSPAENTPFSPTATPPIPRNLAPEAVTDPAFTSLTYGIHAFLWWNETIRGVDLDQVLLMNFSHVKQIFAWEDLEGEQGIWTWDRSDAILKEIEVRGLKLVVRLGEPPDWAISPSTDSDVPPVPLDAWANYCGTVASHYAGRISAYQVWNEPNLSREWNNRAPSAAGYVTLLRACSEAIRAADPQVIIISAGLAPTGTQPPEAIPDMDFLRQMYDAGAAPWFDVLGLNAPGYGAPPELSPDEAEAQGRLRWMCFRHVEDMRGIMVEKGDAAKQIALLEVGWTTEDRPEETNYYWQRVDQQTQADYLVRAYQWAGQHWRPWIGLMVTIYLADPQWTPDDEEYYWAINEAGYLNHATDPWFGRAAYFALANMERYMGDTFIPARDPSAPSSTTVQPYRTPQAH